MAVLIWIRTVFSVMIAFDMMRFQRHDYIA